MNEGLISKRYAKAAFEYAAERGEDIALYGNMRMLAASFSSVPRLRTTLDNPVLGRDDKIRLIYEAAGGNPVESFKRIAGLVVQNRRENLLRWVALGYMDIYRQAHHISVVNITSAIPLSDMATERIRLDVERRTRGKVEMECRVDGNIGGGFVFQVDDFRLDASVAGQLDKIRRDFIRKNRMII